ncbi:hypothetical protein B9T65_15840 [Serratia marcescens]|jgi:hypothetical protein|nr:hypothetical protein JL05_19570 [Serratia nematodiphila DZ0503SBS1]OQV35292.1 hypothetical protein BV901_06645 [Serratia nematodiphila]PHI48092.1 hypothetical protein B9T65_15840 [Serratia marcescens]PNU49960.1 hypothetical protein C2M03_08500 [Serratia marcescens]
MFASVDNESKASGALPARWGKTSKLIVVSLAQDANFFVVRFATMVVRKAGEEEAMAGNNDAIVHSGVRRSPC